MAKEKAKKSVYIVVSLNFVEKEYTNRLACTTEQIANREAKRLANNVFIDFKTQFGDLGKHKYFKVIQIGNSWRVVRYNPTLGLSIDIIEFSVQRIDFIEK